MRSLVVALCVSIFLGAAVVSAADPSNKGTDKASKSRGKADAQDPNIKNLSEQNKLDAKLPAPPQKGGPARRGVCVVHFDNQTQWKIQVFADGNYEGLVGPYGDLYAYAISGATRVYGRAVFDDGSTTSWGPRIIDCEGSYTWSMTNN